MEAVQCFVEVGRRQGASAPPRVSTPRFCHSTCYRMPVPSALQISAGHCTLHGTLCCSVLHIACCRESGVFWCLCASTYPLPSATLLCLWVFHWVARAGARHPQHADLNMVLLDTASMQAWQAAVQKVCLSFQQLQAVLGIRYTVSNRLRSPSPVATLRSQQLG